MKPEIKARWLEALKSGRYEKAREYLKRIKGGKETYCCLGVLCDIEKDNVNGKWETGDYNQEVVFFKCKDMSVYTLDETMKKHTEIYSSHLKHLIELNDTNEGWDEVIKYIEKEL